MPFAFHFCWFLIICFEHVYFLALATLALADLAGALTADLAAGLATFAGVFAAGFAFTSLAILTAYSLPLFSVPTPETAFTKEILAIGVLSPRRLPRSTMRV